MAIESSEFASLRIKLATQSPALSAQEREQGTNWALMQMNYWNLAATSFRNGLLTESEYETQLAAALRIARLYPGMFQLLVKVVDEMNVAPENHPIYAWLRERVELAQAVE